MRSWAAWTAKTALLAAGLVAAGAGPSALAAAAAASAPGGGCDGATAVLGAATAGCSSGTNLGASSAATGPPPVAALPAGLAGIAAAAVQEVLAPLAGLRPVSGLTPLSGNAGGTRWRDGSRGPAAPGRGGLATVSRGAGGGAGPGRPAARVEPGSGTVPGGQPDRLGTLPGLADLPSAAGPVGAPVAPGGGGRGSAGPARALSTADGGGIGSDEFAAAAAGTLLAGAAALQIAGRRARDASGRARRAPSRRRLPAPRRAAPSPGAAAAAGQHVRTARMIRLRRVAFLLPSALSRILDSSQSPYSAWSVRICRAASRDVPRGR